MENPHEYDDAVYNETCIDVEEEVRLLADRLWGAGASVDDIRNEIGNATNNAINEIISPRAEGGGRKPKKVK